MSKWAVAAAGPLLVASLVSVHAAAGVAVASSGRPGPPPNVFAPTAAMPVARAGQTATLLPDGKVLVAGGGTAAAELYDPATGVFAPTGRMSVVRTDATAALLPDGMVLVAGGCCHGPYSGLRSAELYDPSTGAWAPTGSLNVGRADATATLLGDGDVLVAGGACNGEADGCDAGSILENLRSAEIYAPATGTWTLTGSMRYGREMQTATLLRDGEVLVAGGFSSCDDDSCNDLSSAELYDPATAKWSLTGSMRSPREQQSATLLADGMVLVAGGLNENGYGPEVEYASAELYDPTTGVWAPAATMPTKRAGQTATRLRDGWVLLAGGTTSTADVYEPRLGRWVPVGSMSTARTDATATLLADGEVLVAGGDGPDGEPQYTAELYTAGRGPLVSLSPAAVAFGGQRVGTASGTQTYAVTNYGTAGLDVAGVDISGADPGDFNAESNCAEASLPAGWSCTVSITFAPTYTGLRTAEVAIADNAPLSPQAAAVSGYGAGPNVWTPTGSMSTPRDNATATLLRGGKVLVAGGEDPIGNSLASAELYDPATGAFTPTGSLNTARAWATAVRLGYGVVLVAGGYTSDLTSLASAELYDPTTGGWTLIAPMNQVGYALTSILLRGGKVLVTGFGPTSSGGSYSELYDPTNETWTDTGPMPAEEAFGTAVMLGDGSVLAVGGGTTAADLYHPATKTWTATGSMNVARLHPTATLLPDGQVLVAGGHAPDGGPALASSELYNPATGTFSVADSMNIGRFGQSATLMSNGEVLVAGGCTGACGPTEASAEIYSGGFWSNDNSMTTTRMFQTATLLPDGDVLVAGGDVAYAGEPLDSAEVYTPSLLEVSPARGRVGRHISLTGSGFYARERVTLWWNGSLVLARASTSETGTFSAMATVPRSAPGQNTIVAEGGTSFAGAQTTFVVTGHN